MSSMQRPLIFPATHANEAGACKVPTYGNIVKVCKGNRIGFRGIKLVDKVNISYSSHIRKNKVVKCSLYSSSNESNSKAGDFMEGDTAYVNAFVVETAEVRGSSDGLMVLMKDGKVLRCVHNNPRSRHQPDYSQNPLILLKIEEDVTGLLLPLLVSSVTVEKKPSMQLQMEVARPSMYDVVMEMIEKMDYAVKLVRVADRGHGSYFAQLYLTKANDKAELISFDLQPSDALNIAIRCKAPIQVERHLAYNDCLRIIEFTKPAAQGFSSDDVILFCAELDRPLDEQCVDAKEFNLLRNMLIAAVEERYHDAAQWRDKLNQLRSTWLWMFV